MRAKRLLSLEIHARIDGTTFLNGSQERVSESLDERKRFCTSRPEVALIFQTPTKTVSVIRNTNEHSAYIHRCGLRRDFQRLNSLSIFRALFFLFLFLFLFFLSDEIFNRNICIINLNKIFIQIR